MVQALKEALNSPDPSTQNGAILISGSYSYLGRGFNHFPSGVDPQYWHGDKEAKYARVVHAEVSAILAAARNGLRTGGSTLVCPWAACSNCAKHIVDAGVKRLVRCSWANSGVTTGSHWYADCEIGDDIMASGGVEVVEIDPPTISFSLRRNGGMWP